MKLKHLSVENFLGIEKVEFDFKPGVWMLVGRNGAGKSSFFEAIYFALFGKGLRVSSEKGLLIRRGKRKAKVLLQFEASGMLYEVRREISGSESGSVKSSAAKLVRIENERRKGIADGVNNVNGKIKEIIGIDPQTFKKTFLIPQGQIQEIIEDISFLRNFVMDVSGFSSKKEALRDILNKKKDELIEKEKKLAVFEVERRLSELGREEDVKRKIENLNEKIEEIGKSLSELERRIKELEIYRKLEEKLKELEAIKKKIKELEPLAERERRAEKARSLKGTYEHLKALEEDEKRLEMEIEEKTQELKEVKANINLYKTKLEKFKVKIKDLESKREDLKSKREKLKKALKELEPLLDKRKELESFSYFLAEEMRKIEKEGKERRKKLEEIKNSIENLKKELKDVETHLKALENKRISWMAWEIGKNLKPGDVCPVCGGVVKDRGHIHKALEFNGEDYEKLKKRHEDLQSNVTKLQERKNGLEEELKTLREKWKAKDNEKKKASEEMKKIEIEIKKIYIRYSLVGDPVEEIEKLERDINKADKDFEKLLKETNELENNLKSSMAVKEKLIKDLKERKETLKKIKEKLDAKNREFLSVLENENISFEEFIELLEFRSGNFQIKLERLKAEKAAIEKETAGMEDKIDQVIKKLESLEAEKRDLMKRKSEAERSIGQLSEKLKEIKKTKETLKKRRKEFEEIKEEQKVIESLRNLLASNKFDDYYYSHQIEGILRKANMDLLKITDGMFSIDLSKSGIIIEVGDSELPAKNLSGGEKTLVSLVLAMAISEFFVGEMSVFFVDEGFAALDSENRERIADLLLNFEVMGRTVIFITHNEEFRDRFPRVLFMENGRMRKLAG